jgi:hypothetical protein
MKRQSAMIATGAMLLLFGAASAGAQGNATLPGGPKYGPQKQKEGVVRQLVCRGRTGLTLTPQPSFDHVREVAVTLGYTRNPRPAGDRYQYLEPGACS